MGTPLPYTPVGSTMYPGAFNTQQGAAVGQVAGAEGVLDISTISLLIGLAVLPGMFAARLEFEKVATMNMPAGAGDFDDVATTLMMPRPALLFQTAVLIVTTSGWPVTLGQTRGAPTCLADGHSV